MSMKLLTVVPVLCALVLANLIASTSAQTISIPDPGLDAAVRAALNKPTGPLTQQDMLNLTILNAHDRNISSLVGLEAARNLNILFLHSNRLTNFSLPSAFTNLVALNLSANSIKDVSLPSGMKNLFSLIILNNPLTNLTLPPDLTRLEEIDVENNQLTSFNLPPTLTGLGFLGLGFNSLTNVSLPGGLTNLDTIRLSGNSLPNFNVPTGLSRLTQLYLNQNQLTNFTLPASVTILHVLDLSSNQLTNLNLPGDQTNLIFLDLDNNRFTHLGLPPNLSGLAFLHLRTNQLTSLTLPPGLNNLVELTLSGNQLTNLTLPPDITHLTSLILDGNPLTTFVLSERLAATNLAASVTTLRNADIPVFTYPLAVQLALTREQPIGAFRFTIAGPPGDYTVLSSTNLTDWSVLGPSSVPLGAIIITDTTAQFSPRKYYRALRQSTLENMVFVAPNTFTMGSPTNDFDRDINEGPQTTVTLTRGFWIGKYEVTQGEYLSIVNVNPSDFPGDLNRAVSSVSWQDATNYCALLTQRELAAGRIPIGSRYRLPTEAEWECAARAGTSTRFSYGDDPTYASTTNYVWFLDLGHPDLIVHPVGQKLPNPWGLYDMHGNVWEWCLDNYGPLPGGVQTDPTGPASTLLRDKVMRGGAYDYPNSSCRSASRLFRFPLFPDSDVGFRVVLVTE